MKTLNDFYDKYKKWFGTTASPLFDDKDGSMSHLTWEMNEILYSITSPHEGNDFTFLLRVNPKKTFDKWGNADIEEYYDTIDELIFDLEHNQWIYRLLMWTYIDRYIESFED